MAFLERRVVNKYTSAIVLAFGVTAVASAADRALFNRVQPGAWANLQHEATQSYDQKDFARAFALNRRLACAGDKTSQAILGRMYILGEGTARDEMSGYAWIRFAADFGFRDFTSLARKLEAALSSAQRTQGNARADGLRASYGPAVTNTSCFGEARHGVYIIDSIVCTPDSAGVSQVLLRRCVD